MRKLLILTITALFILSSENNAVKAFDDSGNEEYKTLPNIQLPKEIIAILKREIPIRDSGKETSEEFFENCVKQKTQILIEIYCEDVVSPSYISLLEGNPKYIYYIHDGASVENRDLFKIVDGKITKTEDPFLKLLTSEKIVALTNKRFPNLDLTTEKLDMSAHSHYRTRLPRKRGEPITILSGEHGDDIHSYKPIAKAHWNGKTFELIE